MLFAESNAVGEISVTLAGISTEVTPDAHENALSAILTTVYCFSLNVTLSGILIVPDHSLAQSLPLPSWTVLSESV